MGTGVFSVAAGDFNGDGHLDLATSSAGEDTVSILLGTGDGSFGDATTFGLGNGPGPVNVAVADFNNDGHLDLATVNNDSEANDSVSILLGTGTGSFGVAPSFSIGTDSQGVAVGDFNGDGHPDLAVPNAGDNTVSILLGTGTGGFRPAITFRVDRYPQSVAVGDFNGDGHLDLATANYDGGTVSILLGAGTGSFGTATNFGVGGLNSPTTLAVGDFNGDGHPDLAVVTNRFIPSDGSVMILLSTEDGSFRPGVTIDDIGYTGYEGNSLYAVAVGDFNGDGHLDLAVGSTTNDPSEKGSVTILLGTGVGDFGPATIFDVGNLPNSVAVGDFNGDGHPDLAVTDDGAVAVLLNGCEAEPLATPTPTATPTPNECNPASFECPGGTTASDLCKPTDDPCVVSTMVAVDSGSVIDLGTRSLEIANQGSLNVGGGNMIVFASGVTVDAGGSLLARGSATTPGGTITVNASMLTLNGTVDASGAPGGTLDLTSSGPVVIAALLDVHSLSGDAVGTRDADCEIFANTVRAYQNTGGTVTITANGTLTIDGDLDMTGGNGGTATLSSEGDLSIAAGVTLAADGTALDGNGGDISATATAGDVMFAGTLSAVGGPGSGDTTAGIGGTVSIEGNSIAMTSAAARIVVSGARTRSGDPCDHAPEPSKRRCRVHGGAPGTGAPRGNRNARRHGRFTAQSREIRAHGRLLNRVADLARAEVAVMKARTHADPRRVELAEEHVSQCTHRLLRAARALDRVLVERGDEDGRRRLVEGALRLTCPFRKPHPPPLHAAIRRSYR